MQWNIITPTFFFSHIFLQAPARVRVLTRIQSVFIAERAKNLSTLEQRYFFLFFFRSARSCRLFTCRLSGLQSKSLLFFKQLRASRLARAFCFAEGQNVVLLSLFGAVTSSLWRLLCVSVTIPCRSTATLGHVWTRAGKKKQKKTKNFCPENKRRESVDVPMKWHTQLECRIPPVRQSILGNCRVRYINNTAEWVIFFQVNMWLAWLWMYIWTSGGTLSCTFNLCITGF